MRLSLLPILSHAWYGWREDETGIYAEVQVASAPFKSNFAHLKDGKPRRIWIEVGAHVWENLQYSPEFGRSENDFLISFEPLLDKYAMLLSEYKADVTERRPLGFQHQRGLVFPFAVGCDDRYTPFTVTTYDMCSTVLGMTSGSTGYWPEACSNAVDKRMVPCITLRHVIESWLSGQEVFYLKIDAQGFDLNVVQSAGPMLRKVEHIELEGACDRVSGLYASAPNCSTIWNHMNRAGYLCVWMHDIRSPEVKQACDRNFGGNLCQSCDREMNMFFTRLP